MHGTVKIHKKNQGAMWIAKKARIQNTKEELVYMKCWHPSCKLEVDNYRKQAAEACLSSAEYKFDANGWAIVCKADLENVIGSVEVDKHAKI